MYQMSDIKKGKILVAKPQCNSSEIIGNLVESLKTSYGPNCRTKLIAKEEIKIGSSSSFLLNSSLVNADDDATIELIVSSVREHLKVYYDFGLFCIVLCLSVIENSLKLDIPSCLVAECFRWLIDEIHGHLQYEECEIVKRIDASKMKPLLILLQSIIGSKSALLLKPKQIEEFSILLLKSFLKCLPEHTNNINVVWPVVHFVESLKFEESDLYDGVLLDLHHHTDECILNLFDGITVKQKYVVVMDLSLTISEFGKNFCRKTGNPFSIDENLNKLLMNFALKVVKCGISVIFNQKMVSDELKLFFKNNNVVVIDRIGLQPTESLKRVTGKNAMCYIDGDLNVYKSLIDEVSTVNVNGKYFVHVRKSGVPVCSVVVCFANRATIDDLKHIVWASMSSIDKTLRRQIVFKGGGYMEMYLIKYLDNLQYSKPRNLPCSTGQFQSCLNCFSSSLKTILKQIHINESVYDCYEAKLNALIVAIQTACIVLEIKFQIKE